MNQLQCHSEKPSLTLTSSLLPLCSDISSGCTCRSVPNLPALLAVCSRPAPGQPGTAGTAGQRSLAVGRTSGLRCVRGCRSPAKYSALSSLFSKDNEWALMGRAARRKIKILKSRACPEQRPRARGLATTGQNLGVEHRSPGCRVALHGEYTVNMGGETRWLLPRAPLANSPSAPGATGSQGHSPESCQAEAGSQN